MKPEDKFKINKLSKDKYELISSLLDTVENMKHSGDEFEKKLIELNSHLTSPVTIEDVCSYYSWCDKEEFIELYTIPDPYQHKALNDEELIWLIESLKEKFCNIALESYFSTIIQINTGSDIREFDFLEEDPKKVLQELKSKANDSVIYL